MLNWRPPWGKLREQGLRRTTRTLDQPDVHPKWPKGLALFMATDGSETEEHNTPTPHAHPTGENNEGKSPVAELPLRPWITQPTLLAGYQKGGYAHPNAPSNETWRGTKLRYQSRGETQGVYRGLNTDALHIHCISRASIGPIIGRLPAGYPQVLKSRATIPPTRIPTSRATYGIYMGQGERGRDKWAGCITSLTLT